MILSRQYNLYSIFCQPNFRQKYVVYIDNNINLQLKMPFENGIYSKGFLSSTNPV